MCRLQCICPWLCYLSPVFSYFAAVGDFSLMFHMKDGLSPIWSPSTARDWDDLMAILTSKTARGRDESQTKHRRTSICRPVAELYVGFHRPFTFLLVVLRQELKNKKRLPCIQYVLYSIRSYNGRRFVSTACIPCKESGFREKTSRKSRTFSNHSSWHQICVWSYETKRSEDDNGVRTARLGKSAVQTLDVDSEG